MYHYIHIPFCRQKCPYCKFALTPVFDEYKKKRYIGYLKKEIQDYFALSSGGTKDLFGKGIDSSLHRNDKTVKTIYFGGGTPSVLSKYEIQEILECFPGYRKAQEISLESNPEDITEEYVQGLLDLGITRISLGVQTLNNDSLKEIHRSNRESILKALKYLTSVISLSSGGMKDLLGKNADFSYRQNEKNKNNLSLNVDFILGLPRVKRGETLSHIKELHELFPSITHMSVYILEDEHYPKHWKNLSLTEKDMQEEFIEIMDYFHSQGWYQYELSNFAKPGYESIHNRAYWDHSAYRGFGLSASSFEGNKRWSNSSSFSGYYAGRIECEESLTGEQIEIEKMMFGLRTNGWKYSNSKTQELIDEGLLERIGNTIKPTKTGIFLLDYIMGRLV